VKLRIIWDVLDVDIQLRTRQYIPEVSELHTPRRENLKSHEGQVTCWLLKHLYVDRKRCIVAAVFWKGSGPTRMASRSAAV
jgi:hypothetical protein